MPNGKRKAIHAKLLICKPRLLSRDLSKPNKWRNCYAVDCYHTCINGASGSYTQLNGCSGAFSDAKGKNADTVCEITYSDSNTLGVGDSLACNFAIHHTDWSNMNLTNDHSVSSAENVVIVVKKKQIFGKKPE